MNSLGFLIKYIRYLLSSNNAHGIHSPFVFYLYNEVINKKGSYYSFDKIEQLRKKLLASAKEIEVVDLGAGRSGERMISEIASRSAKSQKYCELLFRLAYHFKPKTILELGTSLGISTSYLASADSNTPVITIEGSPDTAAEARKNFEALGLKNIKSHIGNFDTVLPGLLSHPDSYRDQTPDSLLVFIDGNHRKEPTLNYFRQFLTHVSSDSILIFDDIHWSSEMEEAWKEIKAHPQVTVTIDIFFMGLVFFRKEQAKENFTIRF